MESFFSTSNYPGRHVEISNFIQENFLRDCNKLLCKATQLSGTYEIGITVSVNDSDGHSFKFISPGPLLSKLIDLETLKSSFTYTHKDVISSFLNLVSKFYKEKTKKIL